MKSAKFVNTVAGILWAWHAVRLKTLPPAWQETLLSVAERESRRKRPDLNWSVQEALSGTC